MSESVNAIDYVAIISIITSSVIAVLVLAFNYLEKTSERDFEARKGARKYYRILYAHIGILDEITKSYIRSLREKGNAEVFSYKECKLIVHSSEAILEDYKKAYAEFFNFYLKKACLGYEIFISKKLKELLIEFWKRAKIFDDDLTKMKDKNAVTEFNGIAEETTNYMEKLFGLK